MRPRTTQEELVAAVDYDWENGGLFWRPHVRKRGPGRPSTGKIYLGCVRYYPGGYRTVTARFRYTQYQVCHLVLLWHTGSFPAPGMEVDHIDGNPLNNRIENLRVVSSTVNRQNLHGCTKTSSTGLLGVCVRRRKGDGEFYAGIRVPNPIGHGEGKKIYFGPFATPEEAHAVYIEKKRELHEGCTI